MIHVKTEHVGFAQHELTATFVFDAMISETRGVIVLLWQISRVCLLVYKML